MAAKKQETAKQAKERHLNTLHRAWTVRWGYGEGIGSGQSVDAADTSYRQVRAVVYAIIPGKQRPKHLSPAMDKAVTAAARVIRRGS